MKHDPRVDAYIARQAEFAKPILEHIRSAIHAACPEAEETLKWSSPTFMYRGEMLAHMAAFKAHAAFGFWRGSLVTGEENENQTAMGQFGRLTSVDDLPDLEALIRKAVALADSGVKAPRNKTVKAPAETPEDLASALQENEAALATFEAFSPSCRREYVEWITEAKRPETRSKRVSQAVEWMAEGKKRNWKYEKC